jgi:Chitobiase/beta-hexosaminidase C-terminal domain
VLTARLFRLVVFVCFLNLSLSAQTTVTTWRNDNGRTGQNIHETQLMPGNVNSATFGKFFAYVVDGAVYAEPLYISGLNIAGGTHNAVFIATEHDSVYAMDADQNRQFWTASLVDAAHGAAAGATSVPSADVGRSSIQPEIGVTSTPVIDPATKTIYVVAKSKENGGYVERLHALDLTTGEEQPNSPVVISGSVPGAGAGSVNGVIAFQPLIHSNRVSLLLLNGQVYIAYASYGDQGPYHGWVFSYDAATLQRTGIYNASPAGSQGGIWQGAAGLAADTVIDGGRIFLVTGNGTFNANPPYTNSQDFGDSVVALTPSNGSLQVSDAWTPFDQDALNDVDKDQGSTGMLLLPDQAGSHVHELIQVGKNGRIEVLDRDNLGGYKTGSNSTAVQEISGQLPGEVASTPAYWNNNIYVSYNDGPMLQYTVSDGLLSAASVASSTHTFHRGPSAVISSNGTSNGILWAIDAINNSTPYSTLYAFDATDVTKALYNSGQNDARDRAGNGVKFTVPLVADGKVFVGAQSEVDVYGLLANAPKTTAAPTFAPAPGTFASRENISLADTTSGATIYYTTDGSIPTTASNRYLGPIPVSKTTTIRAIAAAAGLDNSSVSNGTYTLGAPQAARPTVSLAAGTYTSTQSVTLADTTSGAVIYYTTDLSTPTTASARYQGAISVTRSTTIRAMAAAPGYSNSAVVNGKYIIAAPAPAFSPAPGPFNSTQNVSITDTASGAVIHYTTDGTIPTAASAQYRAPVAIKLSTTMKAIATAPNLATSAVSVGRFTITPTARPTLSLPAGVYTSAQSVTISDTTSGAVIYYTTDLSTPTTASARYQGPIVISRSTTIKAMAVAPGYDSSAVVNGKYVITAP